MPKGSPSQEQALSNFTESTDTYWYTDDDIQKLLHHYVGEESYCTPMLGTNWSSDIAQGNVLHDNFIQFVSQRTATQDKIFFPVNLNNNHWALLYFVYSEDDESPSVYYFDPKGNAVPKDIQAALSGIEIISLSEPVQGAEDDFNCGPWIVQAAKFIFEDGTLPTLGDGIDISMARAFQGIVLGRSIPVSIEAPKYESLSFPYGEPPRYESLFLEDDSSEHKQTAQSTKEKSDEEKAGEAIELDRKRNHYSRIFTAIVEKMVEVSQTTDEVAHENMLTMVQALVCNVPKHSLWELEQRLKTLSKQIFQPLSEFVGYKLPEEIYSAFSTFLESYLSEDAAEIDLIELNQQFQIKIIEQKQLLRKEWLSVLISLSNFEQEGVTCYFGNLDIELIVNKATSLEEPLTVKDFGEMVYLTVNDFLAIIDEKLDMAMVKVDTSEISDVQERHDCYHAGFIEAQMDAVEYHAKNLESLDREFTKTNVQIKEINESLNFRKAALERLVDSGFANDLRYYPRSTSEFLGRDDFVNTYLEGLPSQIIDSAENTLAHHAVTTSCSEVFLYLLEIDDRLMYRHNLAGQAPLDESFSFLDISEARERDLALRDAIEGLRNGDSREESETQKEVAKLIRRLENRYGNAFFKFLVTIKIHSEELLQDRLRRLSELSLSLAKSRRQLTDEQLVESIRRLGEDVQLKEERGKGKEKNKSQMRKGTGEIARRFSQPALTKKGKKNKKRLAGIRTEDYFGPRGVVKIVPFSLADPKQVEIYKEGLDAAKRTAEELAEELQEKEKEIARLNAKGKGPDGVSKAELDETLAAQKAEMQVAAKAREVKITADAEARTAKITADAEARTAKITADAEARTAKITADAEARAAESDRKIAELKQMMAQVLAGQTKQDSSGSDKPEEEKGKTSEQSKAKEKPTADSANSGEVAAHSSASDEEHGSHAEYSADSEDETREKDFEESTEAVSDSLPSKAKTKVKTETTKPASASSPFFGASSSKPKTGLTAKQAGKIKYEPGKYGTYQPRRFGSTGKQ